MKRVTLSIICTVLVIGLFAQDKIATFNMSYVEKQPVYEVQASEVGDFYISFYSLDSSSPKGGVTVTSDELNKFKTVIDSAKTLYSRWSQLAKENGVTELDKDMKRDELGVHVPVVDSYFLYGGKWYFNKYTVLTIRFKVVSATTHALIVTTGKLKSQNNEYIDSDGLALVFTSIEEVDAFLLALDPQKVTAHYEQKKKKEDLFK